MDNIRKAFAKLTPELRERFAILFRRIEQNDLVGLDVRRLAVKGEWYRIRVGQWRVTFIKIGEVNVIKHLNRRNESTYRDL
jgi:mRNA-degrading endonuclease RelE of RelBE toxin-antitoxin system